MATFSNGRPARPAKENIEIKGKKRISKQKLLTLCLCQQPRYVCFSNHRRIYTSRICFARNHTVLLAATKEVYIRHTYVLPATKDVYIRFEYGYFLLSVVVHVDSFGRWYVVFSILHKKKSVFK